MHTNTKRFIVSATAGLLLAMATPTIADDKHHPNEPPKAAQATPQPKQAQPAPGMGMGMPGGGMMGGGMMGQMMQGGGMMMGMMASCPMMGGGAQSADALKTELGITDAQKAAWDAFAAARAKAQAQMQGMQQTMMAMMDAKSPVERLDARVGTMEKHLAAMKELRGPLAALYGSLSDEQKKKAGASLGGVGCMM